MSFSGTMRTNMVPKIIRPAKYDIQAFQRRDENPHKFTGSKLTMLGALVILIDVKGHSKMKILIINE